MQLAPHTRPEKPHSGGNRSALVSRNIVVGDRRTSVRLEPDMLNALTEISAREHVSIHEICTAVAGKKAINSSLASGLRTFIMAYYRSAATEDGHFRAGHGKGLSASLNIHENAFSFDPNTGEKNALRGNGNGHHGKDHPLKPSGWPKE